MAPKQIKLTHSLFAFQRISQANGVKRKELTADEGIHSAQPKRRPEPTHVSLGSWSVCIGGEENVHVKENVEPKEGQQRTIGGTDAPTETNSLPIFSIWHPLEALSEPTWQKLLRKEFQMKYMTEICCFLEDQEKKGVTVFPPRHLIFNAFNLTPFYSIRVVVIGQDPYHNTGQAHGLSFSVPNGQPMPPSLKNIFKELSSEFPDFVLPKHGTLTKWAAQGVFLLNASLTVQAHKANSHANIGWQQFTDAVIRLISADSPLGVVFLLWGGFAHKKEALIDQRKHRIIKTAHPSPLSAHRFFGCKCFSKTNEALKEIGREPIEWTAL